MKRALGFVVLGSLGILSFAGCGGNSDGGADGNGPGNAPAEVNCEDHCARLVQCGAEVCEGDLGRPMPSFLYDLLKTSCDSSCTQQILDTGFQSNESAWDCMFDNSCRAVLADDICEVDATYSCNY